MTETNLPLSSGCLLYVITSASCGVKWSSDDCFKLLEEWVATVGEFHQRFIEYRLILIPGHAVQRTATHERFYFRFDQLRHFYAG